MSGRAQEYRWIGESVRPGKRGMVMLHEWDTDCPDCGLAFRVFTKPEFTMPRRRCDGCKQKGIKVGIPMIRVWPKGGGGGDASPGGPSEAE